MAKQDRDSDDGARAPRDDDRTQHQKEDPLQGRRPGLEGKGFDAGTGYGGAGNSSQYSGESSYGGQSGAGGSTMRGAYSGDRYGRQGDGEGGDAGASDEATGDEG